jgi:hypothetical protein
MGTGEGEYPSDIMPTILIDGSNVSYGGGYLRVPSLKVLQFVMNSLSAKGFRIITFVDAALKHAIDDFIGLETLIREGEFIQTPAGTSADDFLLQLALRMHGMNKEVYILTNDQFPIKRGGGIIRRIAMVIVPLIEGDEILFIPPLESLLKQGAIAEETLPEIISEKDEIEVIPPVEIKRRDIDRNLLDSLLNFVAQMNPPAQEGSKLAFASTANYLHNLYDGDFCSKFGYSKPKDFATHLEEQGFVTLNQDGATMDMILSEKLVEESHKFDLGINGIEKEVPVPEPVFGENLGYLKAVFESIKSECHYPTPDKISVKLKTLYPNDNLDTEKILQEALENRLIVKDRWKKRDVYWPAGVPHWEATHPDDFNDPYTPEMWADFTRAVHRLPSSEQIYQTRYHMARNLGNVDVPSIASLPQSKREHMVQLAVFRKILDTNFTEKGIRISVMLDDKK